MTAPVPGPGYDANMGTPPIQPNLITLMRLPLAPIAVAFLVLVPETEWWGVAVALGLSITLEFTDAADGYVARKYNAVTPFGKLFDPFGDAFARYTLFMGLLAIGYADLWMLLVIFYRDASISFFRSIAASRNKVVAARISGKIKAIIQAIGINVILAMLLLMRLMPEFDYLAVIPWWLMAFITVTTGLTLFDYLYGMWPVLRAAWNNEPTD
ncbi:MAG: CDP-diacylglycerol--glycerol-3-phosphate 3-phosphatidyltransferase [Kiritimatiellia bacterium]|jgi:CDP-diacylglycerol--glycerol-3-phosphate 3-phosphatidyltransferase